MAMKPSFKAALMVLVAAAAMGIAPLSRPDEPVSARSSSVSVADRNVLITLFLAAAFWSNRENDERRGVAPRPRRDHDPAPEPDPNRKISEQDCTQPFEFDGGNLRCK